MVAASPELGLPGLLSLAEAQALGEKLAGAPRSVLAQHADQLAQLEEAIGLTESVQQAPVP